MSQSPRRRRHVSEVHLSRRRCKALSARTSSCARRHRTAQKHNVATTGVPHQPAGPHNPQPRASAKLHPATRNGARRPAPSQRRRRPPRSPDHGQPTSPHKPYSRPNTLHRPPPQPARPQRDPIRRPRSRLRLNGGARKQSRRREALQDEVGGHGVLLVCALGGVPGLVLVYEGRV